MKRLVGLSMAILVLAASLAGCGDKDTSSSSDEASTSSSVSATENSSPEKTTSEEITESTTEERTAEHTTEADISFVGKWQADSITVNGETSDVILGVPVESVYQFELFDDNTGEIAFYENYGIEWEISDSNSDEIILIIDSDPDNPTDYDMEDLIFNYKTGMLTGSEDDSAYIHMLQVDEFSEVIENYIPTKPSEEKNTESTVTEPAVDIESYVIGKWETARIINDGTEISDLMGIPIGAVIQIEIKENGEAEYGSLLLTDTEKEACSWIVASDTSIEITDIVGPLEFELKDGMLYSVEHGTSEYYFVKVDKFTEFEMEKWESELRQSFDGSEE